MPVEVVIVLVELVVMGAVLSTNRHSRHRRERLVISLGPQPATEPEPTLPAAFLFEFQAGTITPPPALDDLLTQPGPVVPPPRTDLFELVFRAAITNHHQPVPRDDAAAKAFEATGSIHKETVCFVTGLAPEVCGCEEHQ
jgi:hypothetical protein